MKIEVYDEKTSKSLLSYVSDIVPQIGDTYAGLHFEDGNGRKVCKRLLFPNSSNMISICVEFAYPFLANLAPTAEQDLLTQQQIS